MSANFSLSDKKGGKTFCRMSIANPPAICYNEDAQEVWANEKVSTGLMLQTKIVICLNQDAICSAHDVRIQIRM